MTWRLERPRQCAKCPWRKDTDPTTIPDGYSREMHENLRETITNPNQPDLATIIKLLSNPILRMMACHETGDTVCIGWLVNQMENNNIPLRIRMSSCENSEDIELVGEQHETFEDTLP